MKAQNAHTRHFTWVMGIAALAIIWLCSFACPISAAQQQSEEKGQRRDLPRSAFVYQGQLKDGEAPGPGAYDFRFTLHTGQTGGEERGSVVTEAINLANGFFKVELDFGAAGDGKESWLEIAVRPAGGSEPYTALSPRQRLTSTPYAIFAQQGRWSLIGVPIGFVDAAGTATIGEQFNRDAARPVETDAHVLSGSEKAQSEGSAKDSNPQQKGPDVAAGWTDDGTVVRLTDGADRVGIGTTNPGSKLNVIATANEAAGRFEINNTSSPHSALFVSANGSGDVLRVHAEGSGRAAFFKNTSNNGTTLGVETAQGTGIFSFSSSGTGVFGQSFSSTKPAGHFQTFNTNSSAPALLGETNGDGYGVLGRGKTGVSGSGDSFGISGSSLSGVAVSGNSPSGTAGKFVAGVTDASNPNPALEAVTLGTGPAARFKTSGSHNVNHALVVEGVADGILSDITGFGFAGAFRNLNSEAEGGAIYASSFGRGPTVRIIGSAGGVAISAGKTRVDVLEITGGADLAERFEVSEKVRPGMVVAIDPRRPGSLCIARGAYNRRVAGVISGANKLAVGMILADMPGAKESLPLALSGRVWVNADTSRRAIAPGDLLTTADRPGYAMKATDHMKAQGAIIGKAMTGLKKGQTGLVLLLINLQ